MSIKFLNNINSNRYIRNFKRDKMLIFSSVLIILAWAVAYLMFFYKPTFQSSAKVWIKDLATEEFVASLDTRSQLKPLTSAGNPLLTQIELLKSNELKNTLIQYKLNQGVPNNEKNLKIDVRNKIGTDILNISVTDYSPESAKETLKVLLKEYEKINLLINRKIRTSRRKYIEIKLAEINNELYQIRHKIKTYKAENLAISLRAESEQLVAQKTAMYSKRENIIAEIRSTQSTIREMEKQLGLSSTEAINAVALGGGNQILIKLRGDLNSVTQKYDYDSSKYAETNPKMVALQNKIETIKKQIEKQIKLSIGTYAEKQQISIFDNVRSEIAANLIRQQSLLMGLQAKRISIDNSIEKINYRQAKIPQKRFILDNLEQEEKVLSVAYHQLKEKQIEAKIQEAEVASNIIIVDPPKLPLGVSFPSKTHIIILAFILGCSLGFSASMIKTLIEDICDDPELIEKITGSPVLGAIPWADDFDASSQVQLINSLTYDNVISNLIMRNKLANNNVITFTSTSIDKPPSSAIYNIAKKLQKTSNSVVIIDSDLRMPTILKGLNIDHAKKQNLSDLIITFDKKIKQGQNINVHDIMSALLVDDKGIKHLGNKDIVLEPYEMFATNSFQSIISVLKENFDWVLIDIGAPQITPEFLIVSKTTDGVVLFAGKNVTCKALQDISKILKNANIPILGSIMRESEQVFGDEYKNYLELQKSKLIQNDIAKYPRRQKNNA